MNDTLKQRCLAAIDRAMSYVLKTADNSPCVAILGSDKIASINELYETVMSLRNMLPNKDEAYKLRELVMNEISMWSIASKTPGSSEDYKMQCARRVAKLEPLLKKLEVLSGQA